MGNVVKTRKPRRPRRTDTEMDSLFNSVVIILGEYDEPISIRHLFYRCANLGIIEKTEREYNSLRGHLAKWRKERRIAFDCFMDNTRYHFGSDVYNDLGEYMRQCAANYRLNLWKDSGYYVEVWAEKDAVAAALHRIAQEWNLRTFVCRGDPSMSSLHSCAQTFNAYAERGYKPVILYMGDYDESGLAIPKTIMNSLKSHHDCEVEFIRVGVNEGHIAQFNLPTRPPKGKRRGEEIESAVDIDAMKPADMRGLLALEIESFIDPHVLQMMRNVEEAERETLATINLENI